MRGLKFEQLNQLFRYNPRTGILKWRINRYCGRGGNRIAAAKGSPAGGIDKTGYLKVRVSGRLRLVHQIVWVLHYRVAPPLRIDHRDRKKTNNRIKNLRPATRSQNGANAKRRADNKSGFKGVKYHRQRRKWQATIAQQYIGLFNSKRAAGAAYAEAARERYGEFARVR